MCNVAAVAQTRSADETLRQIILQTLAVFPEEPFTSGEQIGEALSAGFGLDIPIHNVDAVLKDLTAQEAISLSGDGRYALTERSGKELQDRMSSSAELETRVRDQWLSEIAGRHPQLRSDDLWHALRSYLAKAFLRHGMQTVAFLDPTVDTSEEYSRSMSSLLHDAVAEVFVDQDEPAARDAISGFLSRAGSDPARAQFIAQCADGAFSFFSLTVDPETSERLRKELSSLILFLDTNFLFGILDLHVHPQVELSNELIRAVESHKLPFELRYHRKTLDELFSTISFYGSELRKHNWPQSLSRAALSSRYMSGIETKYHQRNADQAIDADTFLRPYEHVDVLLKGRGIDVYTGPNSDSAQVSRLRQQYADFLQRIRKDDKAPSAIGHDASLMATVRDLRSKGETSLDVGALLITCDYALYRFDLETSRAEGELGACVLPNLLWQILRPYLSVSADYDKAFAETFALPEFRTVASGASRACSRMIALLASYAEFPEATAANLLSNDMLIDKLRIIDDDQEFHRQVESAIVLENQSLLEDKAALQEETEMLRRQKEADEEYRQRVSSQVAELEKKEEEQRSRADRERERADSEAAKRAESEKSATVNALVTGVCLSILLVIGLGLMVYMVPFSWLLQHEHSGGIQIGLALCIILFMPGVFSKKWRKCLWGTALLPLLFSLFELAS